MSLAIPGAHEDVLEGTVVEAPRPATLNLTRLYRTAQTVATHRHTKRTAIHAGYVPLGVYAVGRMMWAARSTKEYDRRINAAIGTGMHKEALQWEKAKADFLNDRHKRRMERRESFNDRVKASPYIAAGFVAVLLIIGGGLGIANHSWHDVATPIIVVADAIRLLVIVISVVWGPLLLAAPWIAIAALWHAGRKFAQRADAPAWLRTSRDGVDMAIDENTIAQALKALRIPAITDYMKQGLPLQFLTPARKEGRGTFASVRLPLGVTAERIAARRGDLATGLYRAPKEVWPTMGAEAGIMDLWVADKGALAEGAGPYPLLEQGSTDVFRGVPFGKTLKGDPLVAPLMERNSLIGGMPGQGKSSGARVMMVGAALDPTAELRICIPDTNFDFEAMKPRCSVYIMGAEAERIREIRDQLLILHEEVQERGELLVKYQVPQVTRELASAGVGLHPVFFLLEEAHVAITHDEYGKEISGLLVDIVRLGRKRAIHLLLSTQAPTKDSMPRDVTRNCSNGVSYAVGDYVANDALLGQGQYRSNEPSGTDLIPGTDIGVAVVKGFGGARAQMAQSYFLSVARDDDKVTPLIARAMGELERRGLAVPGTDRRRVIDMRDLLADLDAVLGDGRVRLADVPALLRDLAPTWEPYRTLSGVQLRKWLEESGVRVVNPGNVPSLDTEELRMALAATRP